MTATNPRPRHHTPRNGASPRSAIYFSANMSVLYCPECLPPWWWGSDGGPGDLLFFLSFVSSTAYAKVALLALVHLLRASGFW